MARVATFIANDTTGASSPDYLAVFPNIAFLDQAVHAAFQHRPGKFTAKADIIGVSNVERGAAA